MSDTPMLRYPIAGPIVVTQRFGLRESVYGDDGHMGEDLRAVVGTPVMSVADGEVDKSAIDPSGYGEYIRIFHPELNCYTLYGHFSKRQAKVGDKVKKGQVIGLSGNTGNSTGPHLHWEIRLCTGRNQWVKVPGMRYSQVDPVAFYNGFIRALPGGMPKPEPIPAGTVTVTDNGCRVRSGPSTGTQILGSVNRGTKGMATGRNADSSWVKLKVGKLDGWMAAWLMDVEGGVDKLPVVEQETQDDFQRAMVFVRRWEGGYVDHPQDPGGATNRGITIGTLTRWRKAHGLPAPTKQDVKDLTQDEADEIFREWYWKASGADRMAWPMSLAHFDLAVNGGVGRANEALKAVGQDFDRYMAWRINWYKGLSGFPTFGRGWLNRCNDLIRFVGA